MRNLKLRVKEVLLIAAMISFTSNIFAQGYGRGYGRMNGAGTGYYCSNIPNLTQEQQTKLETLRAEHWKNVQNDRNLLAEKAAHLRTLRTAEKTDMKAIDKTIDEMSVIRTKMQKSREKHIQDVRKILTDEQKVYFDNFRGRRGQCRFGRGYGNGTGRGMAAGRGYGRGPGRGPGPCRQN